MQQEKKNREEENAIPNHLAVLWKFMEDRCDSRWLENNAM